MCSLWQSLWRKNPTPDHAHFQDHAPSSRPAPNTESIQHLLHNHRRLCYGRTKPAGASLLWGHKQVPPQASSSCLSKAVFLSSCSVSVFYFFQRYCLLLFKTSYSGTISSIHKSREKSIVNDYDPASTVINLYSIFFFNGHAHGIWKFPVQGLNLPAAVVTPLNQDTRPGIESAPLQQPELLQLDS